jgi:hypothetical protein
VVARNSRVILRRAGFCNREEREGNEEFIKKAMASRRLPKTPSRKAKPVFLPSRLPLIRGQLDASIIADIELVRKVAVGPRSPRPLSKRRVLARLFMFPGVPRGDEELVRKVPVSPFLLSGSCLSC